MARYIDADLIKNIELIPYKRKSGNINVIIANMAIGGAKQVVDIIPTADVQPVIHAHWIKRDNPNYSPFDGSFPLDLICSHCGLEHVVVSNFCPDCGAKMDEE